MFNKIKTLIKGETQQSQPIPQSLVMRFLVFVVVILAIAAGYYHSAWQLEQKKYARLEDNYVRVRDILGREETQRLIDLSQELEDAGS